MDEGEHVNPAWIHLIDQAVISHEQLTDVEISKLRDNAATPCQPRERACGFPYLMDKRRRVVG